MTLGATIAFCKYLAYSNPTLLPRSFSAALLIACNINSACLNASPEHARHTPSERTEPFNCLALISFSLDALSGRNLPPHRYTHAPPHRDRFRGGNPLLRLGGKIRVFAPDNLESLAYSATIQRSCCKLPLKPPVHIRVITEVERHDLDLLSPHSMRILNFTPLRYLFTSSKGFERRENITIRKKRVSFSVL